MEEQLFWIQRTSGFFVIGFRRPTDFSAVCCYIPADKSVP